MVRRGKAPSRGILGARPMSRHAAPTATRLWSRPQSARDSAGTDPEDGLALSWAKHAKWDRLRLEEPRKSSADFDLGNLQFDEAVSSGRLKMPCSTTPAADENGRPAPKASRDKMPEDSRERWLSGGLQPRERMAPGGRWATPQAADSRNGICAAQASHFYRISWLAEHLELGKGDLSPPPRRVRPCPLLGLDAESRWQVSASHGHWSASRPRRTSPTASRC